MATANTHGGRGEPLSCLRLLQMHMLSLRSRVAGTKDAAGLCEVQKQGLELASGAEGRSRRRHAAERTPRDAQAGKARQGDAMTRKCPKCRRPTGTETTSGGETYGTHGPGRKTFICEGSGMSVRPAKGGGNK